MIHELAKIEKIKSNIDKYDQRSLNLAQVDKQTEVEFHLYLQNICQRLLGNTIDLQHEPIMFALSDQRQQNAAFTHKNDACQIVYITENLLKLCENEDQLAFILAHELGHFEEYKKQGQHLNSKAEETSADLRAIQKMATAGYNLEEAHNIAVKLFNSKYISIESLKDPHTNDNTRMNAIDAMIIATKQHIIENKETQINHITPLDNQLLTKLKNRPKMLSAQDELKNRIYNTKDVTTRSKIWLEEFDKAICEHNGLLDITSEDAYNLAHEIINICKENPNQADDLFSSIMLYLEAHKNHNKVNRIKELMSSVLYKIYTTDFSSTYVDADTTNCKTAIILNRYLGGFRESSGKDFDKVLQNFEYISSLVARHNFHSHKGILIKNFNLLELEFNENDIGKHFSAETVKYIKTHINAQDKFETFSGLTINLAGNNVIIKNEKLSNCTIVNRDGLIEFSFSLNELDNMYAHLMAKVVKDAYQDLHDVINDTNISKSEKFAKLTNAYKIIEPQESINDTKSLLQIRSSDKKRKVLLEDIKKLLPNDVKTFFNERSQRPYDFSQSSYTNIIVNNMAEYIKTAPKEEYESVLDFLTQHRQHVYNVGKDQLWLAFLENKEFFSILENQINQTDIHPSSKEQWNPIDFDNPHWKLLSIIDNLHTVTEQKLLEHLSNGGNLNSFEAPFTEQLGKLCGFDTEKFSKKEVEQSLSITRNEDQYWPSVLQQAYMLYYSYDSLKDGYNLDLSTTFGTNCAGLKIDSMKNIFTNYINDCEFYSIHETEKEQLSQQLEKINNAYNTIYQKLNKQIHDTKNWSHLDAHVLFNAILYNSKHSKKGVATILENKEFLDLCLERYLIDKNKVSSILSLSQIINQTNSTIETDKLKEKIFPVISSVFSKEELNIYDKVTIFQNLSEFNLFKSDNIDYYNILIGLDGKSGLLKEISQADSATQEKCYTLLLDKQTRIPDPEIRDHIIKNLASAWHNKHQQYDDRNPNQHIKNYIISEIRKIKNSNIAFVEKKELLKELSELMVSQKELSLALKPDTINIETSETKTIIGAYGIDSIAYIINNYPEINEQMQEFLLGYGSPEEASKLEYKIKYTLCKEIDKKDNKNLANRFEKGEDIGQELPTITYNSKFYGEINPQRCYYKINAENLKSFKKEFDATSLETKALIINELLTTGKNSWQSSFEIVSKKLFEGAGNLAQMGSDFLYSYIDARPDSEKTFYLAAMMAAANNKSKTSSTQFIDSPYTSEQRNLAKGLRLFLEHSGPAGTKLAQAMASYSDVPDFIRFEMQFAKSQANPPARWEIFSDQDEVTSELLKHGPLGNRLGSASFFVTYELGDQIVKILRRGAKIKADNEFSIYKEMLTTLKDKYPNISSFNRLVDNAADNVKIETDLDIGYKQLLDAKKLYPEKVTSDKIEFKLDVMDWSKKGKGWAILEKAQGTDFNNLDNPYKTSVAKAIFSTELANMLSGKRFDSDRHSGQYKIDQSSNTIGIFDTGAISMIEPTSKEQEILGIVLARTIKGSINGSNVANIFSTEIDKATLEFYKAEIHTNKPIPPYLSDFQRGLLALNDFYHELKPKDLIECVINAINNGHHKINSHIVNGFKKELIEDINNKEGIITNLLSSENVDKLAPEARANRRIGKILFEAIYNEVQTDANFALSNSVKEKILPKLSSSGSCLQIIKGMVRGAWAKINPENYSAEDKQILGEILYNVCTQDALNKKLKKDVSIQDVFEQIEQNYPNRGQFCENISTILKTISKVSSTDSEQIKRAAIFVAFADKDVAQGYKRAVMNDKSIGLGKN